MSRAGFDMCSTSTSARPAKLARYYVVGTYHHINYAIAVLS